MSDTGIQSLNSQLVSQLVSLQKAGAQQAQIAGNLVASAVVMGEEVKSVNHHNPPNLGQSIDIKV